MYNITLRTRSAKKMSGKAQSDYVSVSMDQQSANQSRRSSKMYKKNVMRRVSV